MKKLIVTIGFLFAFILNTTSQVYDKHCYYGISFEKSENRNWGYGELVITDVEQNSPAEAAGIKVNDIIMEVNGKATYLRDNVTIADWLFDNPDPVVKFTIRNLTTNFNEYTLNRECITVNSVDEGYLATVFSFYSLENTREQNFTLPLQIKPTPNVDYTDYHTFAFHDNGGNVPAIEYELQAILEKNLIGMGLTKDINDPDIWINLFYEHAPNPLFTGIDNSDSSVFSQRFNTATQKMENYPIYDIDTQNANTKGQYIVKLGFTFFEKKYIDENDFTQMWECSIQDYLSDNLTLQEYANVHIPLILMQYPYSEDKDKCQYYVAFSRHNYTGIHYDADEMGKVNDIDMDSPAFVAGIRPGYKIEKLGNKKFTYTTDEVSDGYKEFITDTQRYRDQSSHFVGIEGYDCMFWNPVYHSEIAKKFKNTKYVTSYSYLYDFEKYVNPNYSSSLNVEAWDGIQKRVFVVIPEIKESTIIKAL